MKIQALIAVLGVTSGLIGCAKENVMQTRLRTQAPKSPQDVGVVLEDTQPGEVEKLLDRNPAAQVRVLNRDHGMYEVFGVSQQVAQAATQGRATDNVYFELQKNEAKMLPFAVAAPGGLQIGELNKCATGSNGPTAKLESLQPADINGSTVELGGPIKLTGANSLNASKSVIYIKAPDSSLNPQTILNQQTAEFTPDALGVYQVALIVQDGRNLCSIDVIRFIVTANRPYSGPGAPDLKVDLTKLTQLKAVSAQQAWQISQGEGITIAVIDTGVDYNHPALAPNIKLNEKEIADNKIDDDGNGFVDDVLGYDFVNNDAFPYDDDSHGTHVSGLAAARQFGLAPKAKILAVKALTGIGGDVGSIAAAIRYSVDRGARIINMSLGAAAPSPHPALVSAVNYAEKKGVLVVVAAGNGDPNTGLGLDIDKQPAFPASLPNDNLVCVASFDDDNVLSSYSNFGKVGVDVVAPGGGDKVTLISAAFENPHQALFIGMSGTSMATPIVSGIAADVMSLNPRLSLKQIKNILIGAGPVVPELQGITVSGRHIDALNALTLANEQNVIF